MKILDRIRNVESLRAWRREAAGGAPVAVLAGAFDFFHPGNLYALRKARELSLPVVALVEPGKRGLQNSVENRVELVAHLREVAAVTSLEINQVEAGLASLSPFVWVKVRDGGEPGCYDPALAALATRVETIAPLAGCFRGDVIAAMETHRTPLALPAGWDAVVVAGAGNPGARPGITVTANGCFDILHVGHLRFLAEARMMGDSLTVLINSDVSVARYKGPTRPVFPEVFRAAALRALDAVDDVVVFSGDNPLDEISRLRPAIHVKGGSYEPDRVRQERDLVEQWGGRLACTPMVNGFSTTAFIQKALKRDGRS